MPGTTEVNMHTLIRWENSSIICTSTIFDRSFALDLHLREDLPTDLTLNLDLHKITPFPMTVPCLNGVGSCEYEVVMLEYILIMVITSDHEFMMRQKIQLKPIFGSHNNKNDCNRIFPIDPF